METNLTDFWSRYAARLAEPPPPPNARSIVNAVPTQTVATAGMVASVAPPLNKRQIEYVKQHDRYLAWARNGNHRPMNSPRVYQRAVCCGRSYVRWRWADGQFAVTGQQCIFCELKLLWR